MNDTPQLLEVKDGVVKGLAERGYVDGKNIKIDFKSARRQSRLGAADRAAIRRRKRRCHCAITTPATQAVVSATKDIPIVFCTVTDPLRAKMIGSI